MLLITLLVFEKRKKSLLLLTYVAKAQYSEEQLPFGGRGILIERDTQGASTITGRFYFLIFMILISLLCNIHEPSLRDPELDPFTTFHTVDLSPSSLKFFIHFKYSF